MPLPMAPMPIPMPTLPTPRLAPLRLRPPLASPWLEVMPALEDMSPTLLVSSMSPRGLLMPSLRPRLMLSTVLMAMDFPTPMVPTTDMLDTDTPVLLDTPTPMVPTPMPPMPSPLPPPRLAPPPP